MHSTLFHIEALKIRHNAQDSDLIRIPEIELPRGKSIAIVGKSGIGKTTFLSNLGLIAGSGQVQASQFLFSPLQEEADIDFLSLWKLNSHNKVAAVRRRYISYLFQTSRLMQNFTWLENACFPLLLNDLSWKFAKQKALSMAERFGLHQLPIDRVAGRLSSGEQQRLALMRALIADRPVLFCDEPTSNLDAENEEQMFSHISEYASEANQRSVIFISHNTALALQYADIILHFQQVHFHNKESFATCSLFAKDGQSRWREGDDLIDDMATRLRTLTLHS